MKTGITSHLEDYLEAILFISSETGAAHASEVAEKMGVTRASVTGALRALADRGLILYHPYQPVVLTDEGRLVAQACADRHHFLHQFFRDHLGMEDSEAESVACKVEHVASPTVLSRMAEFSRFLADCREVDLFWDTNGTLRCGREAKSPDCSDCQRHQSRVSD
jgi:DtxR family transcriptional regulator, Mn-dependent transcriptional regulator